MPNSVEPDPTTFAQNPNNKAFSPLQLVSSSIARSVFKTVFAFPPNRDTMGGTAYLILENSGNILIDCPAWEEKNKQFLQECGGVRWLFLTHRGGLSHRVRDIQQSFDCEVIIQEQEAYLLPNVKRTTFQSEFNLGEMAEAIWTPGHSPGSACLYYPRHGGVLFSGRHLLPNQSGEPVPLQIAKTFHWRRQIQSVQRLRDRLSPETLHFICPGANTGFLRGQRMIDRAYERLVDLDLEAHLQNRPLL